MSVSAGGRRCRRGGNASNARHSCPPKQLADLQNASVHAHRIRIRFLFSECEPADGMSAAAKKGDFGTSRQAARPSGYIDDRPDGRGVTACGTLRRGRYLELTLGSASCGSTGTGGLGCPSNWPRAQRYSIETLRPSAQPACTRPRAAARSLGQTRIVLNRDLHERPLAPPGGPCLAMGQKGCLDYVIRRVSR
jgi:hypothetical protein